MILAPACESTGESTGGSSPSNRGDSGEGSDPSKPAASTQGVSGKPVRVEWRNLNPTHGDRSMGLINVSSPDHALLYRRPKDFKNVKPVEDEVMANLLSAIRESDFFELATKGAAAAEYEMGDGHGLVWIQIGDENWTLLFSPATGAANSALPTTYKDNKVLIMTVWNQTLHFSTSTSGGEGSFRIEPHKHGQPKK